MATAFDPRSITIFSNGPLENYEPVQEALELAKPSAQPSMSAKSFAW
jgi:hypothetical protein